MKHCLAIAVAELFFAIFGGCKAETALEVESWCRGLANVTISEKHEFVFPDKAFSTGFCWGTFGTMQDFGRMLSDTGDPASVFCIPHGTTRIQLIKIFEKYSREHPELSHISFGMVAAKSLLGAFPCPKP
jgi:Rap1a immunity proteins